MSAQNDMNAKLAARGFSDAMINQAKRLVEIERALCGVQTLKERRRLAQEYIEAYDEATNCTVRWDIAKAERLP